MAIFREFDEAKGTVTLLYEGNPITPPINVKDPTQILDVLSAVIEKAYQKLRDAKLI
jgi:hypothetical protein